MTEKEQKQDLLESILDGVSSSIFILNDEIRVKEVNKSFKDFFQKTLESVQEVLCGNAINCNNTIEEGLPCGQTSKCSKCELRRTLIEVLSSKNKISKNISMEIKKGGTVNKKYFKISVSPIKDKELDHTNLVVIMEDYTELQEAHLELERLAKRDGLTNLANHRTIMDEITGIKDRREPFSIIMGDLDHFKKVNDTWGHKVGDIVLVKTGQIMEEIVGKRGTVGRYGGEEFLIVLPDKDITQASSIAEEIRQKIEKERYDQEGLKCTISLGVTSSKEESSVEEIIIMADHALYEAKNTGRNKVCLKRL